MLRNLLICVGLGYLVGLVVSATALIQAAIIRASERNSLPKLLSAAFRTANGLAAIGALLAWGALVAPFLRSGGDIYRFILAAAIVVGLAVTGFAIRELEGLRKRN